MQMNKHQKTTDLVVEEYSKPDADNWTSIFDLVDFAWSVRLLVLVASIIGMLVGLSVVLAYRQLTYVTHYDYMVQLTFPGVTEGLYPNETGFLLTDIIAPAVLSDVHTKNRLGDQGTDLDAFISRVKVSTYSASERAIVAKYEAVFDKRKSSLADVEKLQQDMSAELKQETRSAALIRLDDPNNDFTLQQAQSILIDIVSTWSKQAIKQKGVLRDGIQIVSPSQLTVASFNGLDRINKLRLLIGNLKQLSTALDQVSKSAGGLQVIIPGSSISTLDTLNEIETVHLKLREIAASWPEKAALEETSQRLNIGLFSGGALNRNYSGEEEYLIQLDMFEDALKATKQNLEIIMAQDYGRIVSDPKTGLTAVDIDRMMNEKKQFTLPTIRSPIVQNGVAKNPEVLLRYYKLRQTDLKRKLAELERKFATISETLAPKQVTQSAQNNQTTETGKNGLSASVIPQLDQSFIDRIIVLSNSGNDAEFRRELTKSGVELQNEASELKTELARIESYIATVRQNFDALSSDSELVKQNKMRLRVEKSLAAVFEDITEATDATIRISRRLKYASDLHQIIETEGSEIFAVDFYLRDAVVPNYTISQILENMQNISISIGKLSGEVNTGTYGSIQRLFRPLSTPHVSESQLLGPRSLLLILGMGLIFFFASLAIGIFLRMKASRHST